MIHRLLCALIAAGTFTTGATAAEPAAAADWKMAEGPLRTRWAADVRPDQPWNVYPRPQLKRDAWTNLNGLWDYAIVPTPSEAGATPDFPSKANGQILVPYPIESQLSGVGRVLDAEERLLYRRTFDIKPPTDGSKVLLHFGGVDWACSVRVNGKDAGVHSGGFDPFSFDITKHLREGSNELQVAVADPTDRSTQPRGKQVLKPEGIWYSPVSGIWQTVWLETVPAQSFRSFQAEANRADGTISFKYEVAGGDNSKNAVEISVADVNGKVLGKSTRDMSAPAGTPTPTVTIADSVAWTPENPTLYFITAALVDKSTRQAIDAIETYCAFRDIKLGKDAAGHRTIELNGKPYFMIGLLDQGWWPDGLYTPPSYEAMEYDLKVTRQCGFNTIRKHVKVEPAPWYAACDRMGILVWQDMPSGDEYIGPKDPDITRDDSSRAIYERELLAMIGSLRFFPSIVLWVPFNEGWGQFDSERITKLIRTTDPSRLVTTASGWTDRKTGDTLDIHDYAARLEGHVPDSTNNRAWVIGECGGFALPEPGHLWKDKGWGYTTYKDREALTVAYELLAKDLLGLRADGLCAAIYTQTTDVETEINGVMTYDRDIIKFNSARMHAANKALVESQPVAQTYVTIVPTARDAVRSMKNPPEWKVTFTEPAKGWNEAFFDDATWLPLRGGFGSKGTPGTEGLIGTIWETPDIWLRRNLATGPTQPIPTHITIHHDEDAEVWLDGRKIASVTGYTTGYTRIPVPDDLHTWYRAGKHLLTVHCRQTSGGQYIDVGLCALVKKPSDLD